MEPDETTESRVDHVSRVIEQVNDVLGHENKTEPEDEQRPKRSSRQRESAKNDTTPTERSTRQSQRGKRTIDTSSEYADSHVPSTEQTSASEEHSESQGEEEDEVAELTAVSLDQI